MVPQSEGCFLNESKWSPCTTKDSLNLQAAVQEILAGNDQWALERLSRLQSSTYVVDAGKDLHSEAFLSTSGMELH